jgi:hypothetical protein
MKEEEDLRSWEHNLVQQVHFYVPPFLTYLPCYIGLTGFRDFFLVLHKIPGPAWNMMEGKVWYRLSRVPGQRKETWFNENKTNELGSSCFCNKTNA